VIEIPLGQSENQRLEFKAREALRRPGIIVREIVGMLNAVGGHVWVGLQDAQSRAVAIQPIEDVERQQQRLLDVIVETIEPSPSGSEVRIEVVRSAGGEGLLRVTVRPSAERRPYAQMRRSARLYVTRVGARNRPLARHELEKAFFALRSAGRGGDGRRRAVQALLSRRPEPPTGRPGDLWLAVEPLLTPPLALDDPRLIELLRDASASGNRPTGWSFASPYSTPRREDGALISALGGDVETRIEESGHISLRVALTAVASRERPRDVWPLALVEHPTALLRLAAAVYRDLMRADPPPDAAVLIDIALLGADGWTLGPYSPDSLEYRVRDHMELDEDEVAWEQPRELALRELIEAPDRCAYRLVRRLYRAFGFGEDKIPRQFDRETGRLVIAD